MQASNNGGITPIWFLFNSAGSGSDRDQRKQLKIFLSVYLCINLIITRFTFGFQSNPLKSATQTQIGTKFHLGTKNANTIGIRLCWPIQLPSKLPLPT